MAVCEPTMPLAIPSLDREGRFGPRVLTLFRRLRTIPWPTRIMAVVLLASALVALPYLRGDGNGYYAWLSSAVMDQDLEFANEFSRGDPEFLPSVFDANGVIVPELVTSTGHVRDQW